MAEERIIHPIELIYPRSIKHMSHKLHGLVKGRLWLKVLLGLFFGVFTGFLLGPTVGVVEPQTSAIIGEWLALPGNIFLRIIQMIVIPLIFASIIRGIAASESMEQLKKTGLTVAGYFILTTTIAIFIGMLLAFSIQPGQYISSETIEKISAEKSVSVQEDFSAPSLGEIPSVIGTLLPSNLFGSMINGEMLQIVIFSIIFGIALININPKQSTPLLALLGSLQQVCMTIVKWAMLLAPIAVFGLMAKLTIQFGIESLIGVGAYVGTVLIGLLLMLSLYLCIVFFSTGTTPIKFLKAVKDVQLLAFSTSSSAAVMPLSTKTAEEKLNVRSSISQFIIPLGATVNMDGTALYQMIATIFLAQVFGIELTLTALLFLVLTIVGASIGTPSTPGVGIAILAVILGSMGIPLIGIALILGVDRILDMSRTAVNVTGDLTASTLMNKIIKGKKTAEEQLMEEAQREEQRKLTGKDIIVKKPGIN